MKCPRCSSEKTIGGTVLNQADYFRPKACFRPKGLRPLALTGVNVHFKNNFDACLNCGCVWADLDGAKLTDVVINKAKENIKKEVGV